MTETLRLRCLRCGDSYTRSLWEACSAELCDPCNAMGDAIILAHEDLHEGFRRYDRWRARWAKAAANHPTRVALRAAYEQWEAEQPAGEGPF